MALHELIRITNDFLDLTATLRTAIERMEESGSSHTVLIENATPIAILTLKEIINLYHNGIADTQKAIDYASYPIISIHDDRPLDMAVEMMIDYEIRRIVLINGSGDYVGTLTQSDVLRYYESQGRVDHEVMGCLNKRNTALKVPYDTTVKGAIEQMQSAYRDVMIVMRDDNPIGIVTEKDILMLAHQKVSLENHIADYMHSPIVTAELNEKIHTIIERMKFGNFHHLLVRNGEKNLYVLSEKDLLRNYNTALEVKLEAKLRDAKATYNLLGLAFCEIIDLGDDQIIKWLNAEAMLTFGVKIDDSMSKMLGDSVWEKLMQTLRRHGGVERERIDFDGKVYEATLLEAEVNGQNILKLFLNDVSELIRLGEELRKSLEHTIELEQEKSRLYLEVASVVMLALDTEGNITLINPKGCALLGVSKEEALGKNWFDHFVDKEQVAETKALFNAVLSGEESVVEYLENQVRTKSGEKRIIAWHNAILKNTEGKIIGTFSSGEDITKIRESEREIHWMAHYDKLTKLPNRLLLSARLEHSIERSRREHKKLGVLYIDIDHFKDINESFGYETGDLVIARIAMRLEGIIRQEDTIGRVGGDEFIVVLEALEDITECERILKEIMRVFGEKVETSQSDFQLTGSIGIAIYPDDGDDGETLLKNADIALRQAKETGHNNYCYFTQEMSVQLFERVLMERELRRAVDEKEFVVYYQPQVDLHTGAIIGAEALVRWKHPSLGIIRPDMFIPLAETNQLIIPIGEEVLLQSCRCIKRLIDEGLFEGRISINVSGKQFERPDVVETINRIIGESGLDVKYVELEITESVLMSNPKALGEKLIALKTLGVEVAIDDFGTGYSSLSYLKTFPIDKLKIDQSFVRGIPNDEQDSAIVKAIIAMADALGLKTIAEGIEEEDQNLFLQQHGCQQGQGYLYARPLDEKGFETYLRDYKTLR
ncbi:MAG: EAL domain-containing protein [Sulfuricurvum sp.]